MPLRPRADAAIITAGRFARWRHVRHYVDGVAILIALLIDHPHAQPERSFRSVELGVEKAASAAIHRLPRLIVDPEFGLLDRDGAPGRGSYFAADVSLCRMRCDREPPVCGRRDHHERP